MRVADRLNSLDPVAHKADIAKMVRALPDSGATIVVVSAEIGSQVETVVASMRGEPLARRCRFVVVADYEDAAQLTGLEPPVLLDMSFSTCADPDAIARARELLRPIDSMRAPAKGGGDQSLAPWQA